MSNIRLTITAATASVVGALLLTSCTNSNGGTPQPVQSSTQSAGSTTSNSPEGTFSDLKACDLFQPVTEAQGFEAPKEVKFESDNGCQARKSGVGTASMYLVNAGIDKLEDLGGTRSTANIAGKDSVVIAGAGGSSSCFIGMAVGANARATVSMTLASGSNEEACASAKSIAEQIAPKLPAGN
ncbi:DUF3558 family protein [Amycolatopsis thailandensis]|uniref:DUF3558 family protein n=1 Tax=Amycolatopsis thailandensis TaxID=589330 RepID=UPI0037A52386